MSHIKIPMERWQVKFFLPTFGLLAAYIGAGFGMYIVSNRSTPVSTATALLIPSLLSLVSGFAAMLPIDHYIGENASHVDLLKVPQYWLVTGISLYIVDWITARPSDGSSRRCFAMRACLWPEYSQFGSMSRADFPGPGWVHAQKISRAAEGGC